MENEQEETVSGVIKMSIKNVPIKLELSVPAREVKPQRMLPVLQSMTNAFVQHSVDLVENENKEKYYRFSVDAICSFVY